MNNITETLKEMEQYADNHNVPIINSVCGEFLTRIVKKDKPTRILEIGTAIGYSALLMVANAPANSQMITIEQNSARLDVAQTFWRQAGMSEKIKILFGDAGDILPTLEGYFDMVFIDAAKGQYLDYLQKVMPHLLPGAVIVADNILFRGWVDGDQDPPRRFRTIVKRLREYINFISHDQRFESTIYSEGDGMAVSYYQGENDFEKT